MPAEHEPLVRLDVLVTAAVRRRLEERARRDHLSLGALTRTLIDHALEADAGLAEGVGRVSLGSVAALVEDVREEVRDHAVMIGAVGSATIALQQLLVHWAARDNYLGVSEDELLAQLYAAGNEAWQQVLDDVRDPEPKPAPED